MLPDPGPPAFTPRLCGEFWPLLMETRRGVGRGPAAAQATDAGVEIVVGQGLTRHQPDLQSIEPAVQG